ncbi:MAG: dTMP kinase [Phycisphaeraceae bacterium]|nr:MAG: dTMP kinase [Phycisphaeraceae bacterium]
MPAPTEHALPDRLVRALPGRFLVFDGPDGSGKTTQITRFAEAARAAGLDPAVVRDPGGTHVGERIRELLLEHSEEDIGARTEMLLYMASRAQLVAHRIAPALEGGPASNRFVLADRFYSSTLAYQGTAGGVPAEEIFQAALIACGKYRPDLTVIFDADEDTAASRLSPLLDRMEAKGRAFHARVRQGYIDQAEQDPDHVVLVNAMRDEDRVFADLIATLDTRLGALLTSRTNP